MYCLNVCLIAIVFHEHRITQGLARVKSDKMGYAGPNKVSVTNLVALPTHWRLHHTTTARHPRTTFPITHCTDVTQLIALITHCTDCTDHTLYISLGLPVSHCRVLFCHYLDLWVVSLCVYPVDYLDCLFSSDRLLSAFWIFSLSAACPDLCIVPAYVPALPTLLVTVDWTLPVWPPLV